MFGNGVMLGGGGWATGILGGHLPPCAQTLNPPRLNPGYFTLVLRFYSPFLYTQKDESSEKLKDLAIEMKLTPSAVEYIGNKTPSKGYVGLKRRV